MAQPSHIELQSGYDRFCHITSCLIWLVSAAVVILYLNAQHWTLSFMACALLLALRPKTTRFVCADQRLRLYRCGAATLGGKAGHWGVCYWCGRWYTLLRIDLPCGGRNALVAASRNHPDDYRRLLVWNRFSPFDTNLASGHRKLS